MATVESSSNILTVTDLAEIFGDIPAWRVRNAPAPGTATENDVIEIAQREDRLCELVEGVLVEKTVGYEESCLAIDLATLINSTSFVALPSKERARGPHHLAHGKCRAR